MSLSYNNAFFWLFCNVLFLAILAFYSMLEMACVSFSKVRLQYYINKGNRRANWLNYLLQHPSRLFGTTLIGVNIALFMGSECSRQFHESLGLDPDLAPLSQVIIVVIFGELAPMFAARRFAEHVTMLGIPLIYLSSKVLSPFLFILSLISKLFNYLFSGHQAESGIYITQEELQKILEEQEEDKPQTTDDDEINTITRNIFHLRDKSASDIMEPIHSLPMLSSNVPVHEAREFLKKTSDAAIPLYHKNRTNIVGVVLPRDLVRASETKKIRDYSLPPWFVSRYTTALQLIKQFRRNKQSMAIILDAKGLALGVVHLDDIIEEIFGKGYFPKTKQMLHHKYPFLLDKTFPGSMKVGEFNKQYGVHLHAKAETTLAELLTAELGHHPEPGESIYIEPFELIVKETTFLDIKSIKIQTIINA